MPVQRRLHHESLERRRLLAASCVPAEVSSASPVGDDSQAVDALRIVQNPNVGNSAGLIAGDHLPLFAPLYFFPGGPDLLQEDGNKLYVVDQPRYSSLAGGNFFIFERAADGALETVAELEIGFAVDEMIVRDDQVLLIGNDFDFGLLLEDRAGPRTAKSMVMTVNLGEELEVIRQEFEGHYHQLHHDEDRIVMVSSEHGDVHIAIYPPPALIGTVKSFDITDDGLRLAASAEVPIFGMTALQDRDFYSATTTFPEIHYLVPPADGSGEDDPASTDPNDASGIRAPDEPIPPPIPFVSVTHFLIGEDEIREASEVELGSGFLSGFEVAEDGQTAITLRNEFGAAGPASVVDLLDLSGDEIRIFEAIRLPDFHGRIIAVGSDHVVLRSYDVNELLVIDTNQSIDLAAENRVRRIEIPAELDLHHQTLRVNEDRLVLRASRLVRPNDGTDGVTTNTEFDANGNLLTDHSRESVLLTVSISEARVIADTAVSEVGSTLSGEQFVLIDGPTQRIGIMSAEPSIASVRAMFVFGHLNDDGEFVVDGQIPVGRWIEVDANADRLIARESDRMLEYRWDDVTQPTVTPLGEPDPEPNLEAVDDEFTLNSNGEDHLLDVIANDLIEHFEAPPQAEIVELIGAPDGAEIVRGNKIRIPAEALEGVESLRFEYVLSNGRRESTAVVEIDVVSISEEQVRELVEAIRRQAADDFNVSADDVDITFVERIFNEPLPIVRPDGSQLDLSPGILVTLTVPEATALYAASLEGEIIQVFASGREFLVELGLRAVDQDGQPLDEIVEGDEFWLEFNAKDLREFGRGVFAAFFDLVVPTEHLVVTGPVEYGDGFVGLPGSEVTEGEIDELGALSNRIEAPGSERQEILRIGVRAVGAGEIVLEVDAADEKGTETLLRDRETEVPRGDVRYTSLTLNIQPKPDGNPLDADGSGDLTASDALVVINFLGRYGTTSLDDLAERVRAVLGEGEQMSDQAIAEMRRYDTNGSGEITALDALVIVNGLQRQSLADSVTGEQVDAVTLLADDDDDDDDPIAG